MKNNKGKEEILFLVRHGETDWNRNPKRLQGRKNIPLNAKGIDQAECLAEFFKDIEISTIFSSPLSRAYQTANIINRFHNLPIEQDEQLIEMDFGIWECPTLWNCWKEQPEKVKILHAETLTNLIARLLKVIQRINALPGGKKLIITHGAFLRATMIVFSDRPLSSFNKIKQNNGSINAIADLEKLKIIKENYTKHLKKL
jgi:broad specificity phosphatase PhoE